MNVNPQLQFLQKLQNQGISPTGLSPQISHLQLQQQQQQLQKQQLLSQHLQQRQQQAQPQLNANGNFGFNLSSINGSNETQGNGPGLNPILQLQLQQQLQQQQQQQLHNSAPLSLPQVNLPQLAPTIKEVWSHNLEFEFQSLRSFISDKSSQYFITSHQEIPGVVLRPVGTFKSPSDYHFQTLRSNSDLLSLIQLSLCLTKINNNEISSSVIWQFNFFYDLKNEMFNEEHLAMLSLTSQINFPMHMAHGIDHFTFAELFTDSGLLLDDSVNWISYHAGYDLGFFISLFLNTLLPSEESEFYWWCSKYFPKFYDLKFLGNQFLNKNHNDNDGAKNPNNKPSIEYLAEELHLLPLPPAIHQYFSAASSAYHPGMQQQLTSTLHAYLSMECFKELLRKSNYDLELMERYKGFISGLGNIYGNRSEGLNVSPNDLSTPMTPGGTKSGLLHFGRPL